MTLQQLRYVIEVAKSSSIHTASKNLFITQPTLSKAIMELENEMQIQIFHRTNRGVVLTDDGIKFLSYAQQVVEQADLLESSYKKNKPQRRIFAISSQHYAFVVNAFVELVKKIGKDEYEFSLRELRTFEIIEEVKDRRSEIGILYLSKFNKDIIKRNLNTNELRFNSLFKAKPHIFVSNKSPLAEKEELELKDLENYTRLIYDQGVNNSFYYAEEPHSLEASKKNIVVTDRATLFNLLIGLDGYTISSGILSKKLNDDNIKAIPLKSNEEMNIGYISRKGEELSQLAKLYLENLDKYIKQYNEK